MFAALARLLHRKTYSLNYIPEVDGIRFLAIFMVFLHHAFSVFGTIFGSGPVQRSFTDVLMGNGFKGIHIFFVLSGFILALPFIKWRESEGQKVSTKSYFLRRLIRLEPPYILSLLICVFMQWDPTHGPEIWRHFFAAVFYSHNLIYGRFGNPNGVGWTLEIEAQFYILAPLIFQVFRLQKGARRLLLVTVAALFCMAQYFYAPATPSLYLYIPYFLLGAAIADIYADGGLPQLNGGWVLAAAALLYGLTWYLPILQSKEANLPFPFIVAALLFCIFNNNSLRRLFSLQAITIIGGMCYSIYLLHYPVLFFVGNITKVLYRGQGFWKNFAVQLPLYAIGVLVICSIYFLLVEKPFMLARRRKKVLPLLKEN